MQTMYYIGLDVHKRTISYCVKDGSGTIPEGTIPATRFDLEHWMKTLPQPWTAAMEATALTGWIYDYLLPHAAAWKSGSIRKRNHGREANTRGEESESIVPALLRSAPGELLPS